MAVLVGDQHGRGENGGKWVDAGSIAEVKPVKLADGHPALLTPAWPRSPRHPLRRGALGESRMTLRPFCPRFPLCSALLLPPPA